MGPTVAFRREKLAELDAALERDDYRELFDCKLLFAAMSAEASIDGQTKAARDWAGLYVQARDRLAELTARRKARQAAQVEASGRVALFEVGGV